MDARGRARDFLTVLPQGCEVLPRIEELKRGAGTPALPDDWSLWHGTRRHELYHKAARRDDDKAPHGGFSGPEHTQHGAVEGLRNPRHHSFACKPQHGEEHFNYALERFAVAFDGPGPVHGVSLSIIQNKTGTFEPIGIDCQGDICGYGDKSGRVDRMNFGGVHGVRLKHNGTLLTLVLDGFDSKNGKMTDANGSLSLLDERDNAAASWTFAHLMELWNRKHAKAVYVPALAKILPERHYKYGPRVRLGEGTDFNHLLTAIAAGTVYYDPGIKLEGVNSENPKHTRRSQFRVRSRDVSKLYFGMTTETV